MPGDDETQATFLNFLKQYFTIFTKRVNAIFQYCKYYENIVILSGFRKVPTSMISQYFQNIGAICDKGLRDQHNAHPV